MRAGERNGCGCGPRSIATQGTAGKVFRGKSFKPEEQADLSSRAQKLASVMDHTLLRPDATVSDVARLCREARQYRFKAVCVASSFASAARGFLDGTPTRVCAVVGFPHGNADSRVKAFEARGAAESGADELDMVLPIGALKFGDFLVVQNDIAAVRAAAPGCVLKVILETALLERSEKVKACQLARMAGADFVKTSTGFGPAGATLEDVRLLRETVGTALGVKAAGGIRTADFALRLLEAGADRLGASASVEIIRSLDLSAHAD